MPLPPPHASRQLKHRRAVSVEAFLRDDRLWEIDARLADVKTHEVSGSAGVCPAGSPIHDLMLRLIVDTDFDIVAAGAESLAVPYPGHCDAHGDAYERLVGLNLMRGFRRAVRERLGGLAGCTHLTELTDVLPTAVVQAFSGKVLDPQGDGQQAPFHLDRCHALATDGEVVRLHYPRWFRQPGANKVSQNRAPVTPEAPLREPAAAGPSPSF